MIKNLINKLTVFQDFSIEGNVEKFEEVITELASTKNPEIIENLFPFFDDNCDFPEVMFSIIHTIESFNDVQYLGHVFLALREGWYHSAYWVKVLHFRIFNSKDTLNEYIKQVKDIDPKTKMIIREIVSKIKSESPKFEERCDLILSEL